MVPRLFTHAAVLGTALLGATTALVAQDVIPVEAFFDTPALSQVQISADGQNLAYLAPMNGRIGVAIQPVSSDKADVLARSADNNIDTFFWKGSDYVVFMGDDGGGESYAIRSIDIRSRKVTPLNSLERYMGKSYSSAGLTFGLARDPEHVILTNRGGYTKVHLRTGDQKKVRGYEEGNLDVFFDQAGVLRGRLYIDDGKMLVQFRPDADSDYKTVLSYKADAFLSPIESLGFLADNTTFYAIVNNGENDRGAIVKMDTTTGTILDSVFTPPSGTLTAGIFANDRTALIGARYEDDRERVVWFDETFKRVQATVDKAMPTTLNTISDWSDDLKRFVVVARSDVQPPVYLLYDRSGPKARLMPIGHSMPNLDAKKLRPMTPISFKARDGMEIPGYVTRPAGFDNKPAPLIIMPHGGPYGIRDSWDFDADTQFLASRGYAVLRVNYRGSGGYGVRHLEAGRFEWGKKMQDDLTDAVKWAVAQGIADPNRIGWLGGSYGGYAVLAAGVYTPDIVKCIVNIVGVSDLTLIKRLGGDKDTAYIFADSWLGNDKANLRERSPVNFIENLRAPSFHAYGLNDPRVDIEHWNKLESALKKHNKPYESIVEKEEGHGFQDPASRIKLYKRVEKFLEKNL